MNESDSNDPLQKKFASVEDALQEPGVLEMLIMQFGPQIATELRNPKVAQMIRSILNSQGSDAELLDVAEEALPRIAFDGSVERQHDIQPLEPILLELQGIGVRGVTAQTLGKIFAMFNSDEVQQRLAARKPVEPIRNQTPKVGRNDPCPCGCGQKLKKCPNGTLQKMNKY